MAVRAADKTGRATRVMLVDDHPLIHEGLMKLFDEIDDVDLVGFAPDGEAAPDVCRRCAPDVVLMDLRLPGIDGIEATRRLVAGEPSVGVLLLTAFPSKRVVEQVTTAGAVGCLSKDDSAETMLDAIRAASAAD
jgi:DNA-binding NarL/FixJ family response regulator